MSTPDQPLSGRMESLHFARLLARFWLQGFSGSFRSRGGPTNGARSSKEVLFERGRVAWAASDDPLDSIKTHLVNRGILRSEQWRLAQEKAGSAHPRQALVEMGLLTARELHDADRERICRILLDLFNWVEGDYALSPSPLPPGTPNLQIDPRDLVLEGIMASGDRERVLEEIGSLEAVLVVRPDDLARAALSLPVELVDLMGKADGTRSVAEICALSPLQDFMICAAFAGLKALGLATAADGAARVAPPAPPRAPAPVRAARRSPRTAASLPPGRSYDAQRPRLPLDEEVDEGATSRTTATLPGGIAASSESNAGDSEDEDDSGTVRMTATPASGVRGLSEPEIDIDEDDPGTRPMTATPPGGTHTVKDDREDFGVDPGRTESAGVAAWESAGLHPEAASASEEREGETDLTPGIPVPSSADGGRDLGLLADEIESVVQSFSTGPPDSLSPDMDPLPLPDESLSEEIDPDIADAPTWIYEPSGGQAVARGYAPWVKWAGMAAGLFAVGTIVTLFFGAGSAEPGSPPAPQRKAEGPPPVDIPMTETIAERPPTSRTPAAPEQLQEPVRRQETETAESRQSPGVASLSPQRSGSLASPGDGNILLSGPFRDARNHLGAGRLREAARGFEGSLAGRRGLYTVQFALACSPDTVAQANRSTGGADEFFILPKEFDGRACYRLLWGAYPGRQSAENARTSVPAAFRKTRDAPFVAPL